MVLTALWIAMVGYVGVRVSSNFHVGFSSCLPADFPNYPRETLSSIVVSDSLGNCTVQYQTRDSADDVTSFFERNLAQGDWTVTRVDGANGLIVFRRNSRPRTTGYVKVLSFPGAQTQFQIQLRMR